MEGLFILIAGAVAAFGLVWLGFSLEKKRASARRHDRDDNMHERVA